MAKINSPSNMPQMAQQVVPQTALPGQPVLPYIQAPPQAPQIPQQVIQPAPQPVPQYTPNVPYQVNGEWHLNGQPMQMTTPMTSVTPTMTTSMPITPPPIMGLPPVPQAPAPPAFQPPPINGGMLDQMAQMMQQSVPTQGGTNGDLGVGLFGSVNWSTVDDSARGRLLPIVDEKNNPIDYEARVTKATWERSKAGNPQVECELITTYPVQYAGVKFWTYLGLGEKEAWKTKSMFRSTGTLAEDGNSFAGHSEQDFVDCIVGFQIMHDEYPQGSGKMQNKINGGFVEGTLTPGLQPEIAPPPITAPVQQMVQPQSTIQPQPTIQVVMPTQSTMPNFG